MTWGIWSLAPLVIALVIAFKTRSAAFSLLLGSAVGVVMLGTDPATGLSELFQSALGNGEFIRLCLIISLIGILFVLLKDSGAIATFANKLSAKRKSQKGVALTTWGMGFFIVDDYFSPLMTGAVMRPLTDRVKIPREKLAFILDSTTASVCILVPFTAWAAYIVGLIVAQGGPVETAEQAMQIFVNSIPYNFYSILLLIFALGICLKIIPDFGPMRKAEKRVEETGALLREGAMPLISAESDTLVEAKDEKVSLFWGLAMPAIILFGTAIVSYITVREVMIAEAFMGAVTYLSVAMLIRRQITSVDHLVTIATRGIKDVVPALIIIALAYCINVVTKELGAANFLISQTEGLLTPALLVAVTFMLTAFISFSTGTSWGAYALMVPIALPVAYSFTGNQIDPLVFKTIAAVAGGGIFGDHASPVSDTSVLSSAGAGSDHMDHVITQLPYALTVAGVSFLLYLIV
ncbi:Na+/H+ antiporter NhaC family protein [Kordiimonas sediminis]|nr:Na+/H+ antiporter NhaC family protein [Kordiimonas sediminis]